MAYILTYASSPEDPNWPQLNQFTVNDGTLNQTTSLRLPGRNYAGYGIHVDQDLVDLMEHFASSPNGPSNAIKGQMWFDINSGNKLKVNVSSVKGVPIWKEIMIEGGNIAGNIYTRLISTGGPDITGLIIGNWSLGPGSRFQATYADLAERFEADSAYEPGTVVELGGEKEITAVREDLSDNIFGVVSRTAGYLMNAAAGDDLTHPAIAMTGRVPVKIRGQAKKGDRLVSAGNGFARAAKKNEATPFNTVGRALEDKLTDEDGKILAAVSAKL